VFPKTEGSTLKIFTKSVVAAIALLTMTGCETVDGWMKPDRRASVKSETPAPNSTYSTLDNAPGIRSVPDFPVPGDRDLKIMTSKLSGGSVEIYDLDGPVPLMDNGPSVPPVYMADTGIPLATDPRVTVYPLDGDYSAYPVAPSWPNATLPINPMPVSGPRTSAGRTSIYFPHGSANIEGKDQAVLLEAVEAAKFAPVDRVIVEGYASQQAQTGDPVRAKILNLKESLKRASTVSEQLIEQGVPAEKIKTVGWGDTKPSGGDEAQERRVDIVTGGGY